MENIVHDFKLHFQGALLGLLATVDFYVFKAFSTKSPALCCCIHLSP